MNSSQLMDGDYNPWIPLCHDIFVFLLSNFSLYSSINVLFYKFFYRGTIKLLPILQIYFAYIFIWSLASLINNGYLLLFWRPQNIYNQQIMYLFGFIPDILLFLNSIMVIFLCFDRCCSIIFPIKYMEKQRKFVGYFAGVTLIVIYSFVLWYNKTLDLIPLNQPTTTNNCYYRGCIVRNKTAVNFSNQKMITSIFDIIAGIILFILIRCNFRDNKNSNFKRLNIVAVMIVVFSILFDFLPNIFFRFIQSPTERSISDYVGPYLITLSSTNVTICAAIYSRTFRSTKVLPYKPKLNLVKKESK